MMVSSLSSYMRDSRLERSVGHAPLWVQVTGLLLSPFPERGNEAGKRGYVFLVTFNLAPCGWCEVVHFAAEDSGLPRIIAAVQVHISTRDA